MGGELPEAEELYIEQQERKKREMSKLNDLLERRRGRYRAEFGGSDLGELASPPEINADYDSEKFTIHALPSRKLEGCSEKYAEITLKLKGVSRGFGLLSSPPETLKTLKLHTPDETGSGVTLEFPESELLETWQFEPSFAGDHILTLHFLSRCGANGQLFYFTGT